MLVKKADVKNHLAAKLRKRRMLQGPTSAQMPAERSSTGAADTAAVNGSPEAPSKPASEFVLPIRSSGGH